MATLNTSANGPAISASYNKIVNASASSGAAASSPTYGQWALFSVQAPLVNAFTQDAGKESVLKVQTTGEGELVDLIEDFSDGRIQFAFVKVKDPNTTLPKSVLIAWCGEGVPERTKGYFTSHLNAVSRILHGYHVQVTARSDRDLTPQVIVQKVQDASGSKYSGGGVTPSSSGPPPPAVSKPVMPTKSFGAAGGFQPLGGGSRRAPAFPGAVDNDGWGQDAPPVTRSQLEKVEPAYKPTKVDINALQSQKEPSRYQPPQQSSNGSPDVVKGGYQPIGKVDIAALRKQAQEQGSAQDERPTVVKGSYEPVGKVDIAAIRKKAQGAPPSAPVPFQPDAADDDRPKSLADRSAAFNSVSSSGAGGRLTSLPKPQIANKFGSTASSFTGTKPPNPSTFGAKPVVPAAPVGITSRTFADEGGMTPAQQWEAKRRQRGMSGAGGTQPSDATTTPLQDQQSGGWQSGYGGKKWGVQIQTRTGGSGISEQKTGQDEPIQEENDVPLGGISSIRDRFKNTAPMGGAAAGAPEPPALDTASKPNAEAPPRGVPMPGLPSRPSGVPSEQHQDLPPPPPRGVPEDEEEEDDDEPQGSPVRIAMPIAREKQPELEPAAPLPPRPFPAASLAQAVDNNREEYMEPESQITEDDPSRSAGQAAATSTFGHNEDSRGAGTSGGREAIAQYDYEKAEENELELHEGERVTNIDMIDEDWWMGQNSRGETGLFPSNYVEIIEDSVATPAPAARPVSPLAPVDEAAPPAASPAPVGGAGPTATAQYDYEAAEDNELNFPDGATITGVEFPDGDWWFGHYGGKEGLFPANYVVLDE